MCLNVLRQVGKYVGSYVSKKELSDEEGEISPDIDIKKDKDRWNVFDNSGYLFLGFVHFYTNLLFFIIEIIFFFLFSRIFLNVNYFVFVQYFIIF